MIIAARKLVDFGHSTVMDNAPVDPATPQFVRYLANAFAREEREIVIAFYLDAEGRYLTHERLAIGAMSAVEVTIRPLAIRALEVGARGVLLAHNHPSGDARPSIEDRDATARIGTLLAQLGIDLVDHLVVGGGTVFSVAEGGQL